MLGHAPGRGYIGKRKEILRVIRHSPVHVALVVGPRVRIGFHGPTANEGILIPAGDTDRGVHGRTLTTPAGQLVPLPIPDPPVTTGFILSRPHPFISLLIPQRPSRSHPDS